MDTREPPGRASPARSIEWRAASPAASLEKILDCLDRMSREEDGRGHGHRILETLIAVKGHWYLMPGELCTLSHPTPSTALGNAIVHNPPGRAARTIEQRGRQT